MSNFSNSPQAHLQSCLLAALFVSTLSIVGACGCNPEQESSLLPDPDPETTQADMGEGDMGTREDASPDLASEDVFPEALWSSTSSCEGFEPAQPDRGFSEPNTGGIVPLLHTAEQLLLGKYRGGGVVLSADSYLDPGYKMPLVLWAKPGEDIKLYIDHVVSPKYYKSPKGWRGVLNVFVDYKEVSARLVRYDATRQQKQQDEQGSAMLIEQPRPAEMVEVTIPASAFEPGYSHDVSLSLDLYRLNPRAYSGYSTRILVHYGGTALPRRPCSDPPLQALPQRNGEEFGFNPIQHYNSAMIFPDGILDHERLLSPLDVEPGQEVTIYVSMREAGNTIVRTQPVVLLPLLEGKPVAEPLWVSRRTFLSGEGAYQVDARRKFVLTMPSKPGLYDVKLLVSPTPYESAFDEEGDYVPGVFNGTSKGDSNVLRFEVISSTSGD